MSLHQLQLVRVEGRLIEMEAQRSAHLKYRYRQDFGYRVDHSRVYAVNSARLNVGECHPRAWDSSCLQFLGKGILRPRPTRLRIRRSFSP